MKVRVLKSSYSDDLFSLFLEKAMKDDFILITEESPSKINLRQLMKEYDSKEWDKLLLLGRTFDKDFLSVLKKNLHLIHWNELSIDKPYGSYPYSDALLISEILEIDVMLSLISLWTGVSFPSLTPPSPELIEIMSALELRENHFSPNIQSPQIPKEEMNPSSNENKEQTLVQEEEIG